MVHDVVCVILLIGDCQLLLLDGTGRIRFGGPIRLGRFPILRLGGFHINPLTNIWSD